MGLLLLLSVRSSVPGSDLIWDKLAHAVAYAALCWLCLRATHGGIEQLRLGPTLVAVLVTLSYGALAEWQQATIPERSASVADWLADAVGALLALPLAQTLSWCRRRPSRTAPEVKT